MLVKLDMCSPNRPGIGKSDENFERIHSSINSEVIQNDAEKRHVSFGPLGHEGQTKRRRLELSADEKFPRGNHSTENSTTKTNVKEVDYDEQLGFLEGHDFDVFNIDGDRQELMDYCEKMLEECDGEIQRHSTLSYQHQQHHHEESISRSDATEEYDDSRCTMGPKSSFDDLMNLRSHSAISTTLEIPRLKSAYYFDGQRFVAIQVVMDSGKCQLVLPIDHPHHLGVPEEVPVFETKTVSAEEFIKR